MKNAGWFTRRKPFWGLVISFAVVCLTVVALYLIRSARQTTPAESNVPTSAGGGRTPGASAPQASISKGDGDTAPATPRSAADFPGFLSATLEDFAKARSLEDRVAIYAGLRDHFLSAADRVAAAEAIAGFLAGGRDIDTGLEFLVGNDGFLDTAPTLRTALLDFVAELDAGIALRLAREIMDARTTPDEYAVALRNLAWSPIAGEGRETEVTRRFSELLDQASWLANPSIGFLEAFDAAVALSNRSAILDLASVAGLEDTDGNPVRNGVNEAASLALDRIMVRAPGEIVARFEEDPSFLAHRPGQRATLLARLDLRKRNEFDRFRDYLNEARHAPDELEYFASLFPNTAFSYGHRLISTQEKAPSISEMQETDREFLRLLNEARNAGTIRDTPAIWTILSNLQSYVDEANATATTAVDAAPALGFPNTTTPATPRPPEPNGAPGRIRIIP